MISQQTLLAGAVSLREMPTESAISLVCARLDRYGAALVRQMPTDDANATLVALAHALGTPTDTAPPPTADHERLVENQMVHRVEALPAPLRNSNARAVLSTTAETFLCHTDQYFADPPPDIVMFLCVRPDAQGQGKSLLAHVDAIAAQLAAADYDMLCKPNFPQWSGLKALITSRAGKRRIRFNPYDIQCYYEAARIGMPNLIQHALQAIQTAIEAVVVELLLNTGDCLIVDNTTVLHGRRSFPSDSCRLIKRVRLHAGWRGDHFGAGAEMNSSEPRP